MRKIACNKDFNQAWVKLQREMGELLSMCYQDADDVKAEKWFYNFSAIENSLRKIRFLKAKEETK